MSINASYTVTDLLHALEEARRAADELGRGGGRMPGTEALLEALLDDFPSPAGLARGRVMTAANRRLLTLLDRSAEEVLGQDVRQLYCTDLEYTRVGRGLYHDVANSGTAEVETVWRRRDGQLIDVVISATGLRPEEKHGTVVFTVLDITRRELAERARRASENRFRNMFESSPMGVLLYSLEDDDRLVLIGANPAADRILGIDHAALVGRTIEEAFPPLAATEVPARYREACRDGTPWSTLHIDYRDERIDGAYEVYAFQVELGVMAAYFLDVTESRLTAQRLADSVAQLRSTLEGTIRAMAVMVEMRDPYTSGHQRRASNLAVELAKLLGLDEERVDATRLAATIHDVGKIAVPAEILSKPGSLTGLEMEMVRTHAESGYQILRAIPFPWPVAEIVREHHEFWDGSGYPRGLAGEEIRLEARILSVADAVEAISNHRPYRAACGVEQAIAELRQQSGRQFDPRVVDACEQLLHEGRLAELMTD